MISPLEVAEYFIIRAYEDGRENEITNMKIQKLLYYTQCLHLALYNEPLFAEEIQAWRYNPVCPPAYRFYSEFEANQLPIPTQETLETLTQETIDLLEEVWQYFGEHHAYFLSDMTHGEFPWKKARTGLSSYESSTNPILLEDMQLLGEEKLLEIERNHSHYEPIMRHLLEEAFNPKKEPQYIQEGEIDEWLNSLLP